MATASHGYEPGRMTTLELAASTAVRALRAIASSDPAAAEAMAALRNMQTTVETGWLPAIRLIRRSTALSGGIPVFALGGGGGSSSTWKKSEDGPEPGTFTFQPFNALSALFPGDDDITAEEIVDKINEILERDPSEQQLMELGVLANALEQIAEDGELSQAVLVELGPGGVQDVYTKIFQLGFSYPLNPTLGTDNFDATRYVGGDLAGLIGDPFNQLVAAGAQGSDGRRVVLDALDRGAGAENPWEAAVLAGLARAEDLPDDVAVRLLEVVKTLDPSDFATGLQDLDNTAYPELEYDIELLELFAISNNSGLMKSYVYGPDGFVPGGAARLADMLETNGFYYRSDADIGAALGDIIERIIATTPKDDLIVIDGRGRMTEEGVVYDIVQLLLDNDLKVSGASIFEQLAPFLPEIATAFPGTESPFDEQQVRALFKDLFNDMSRTELDAALALMVESAVSRIPDLQPGTFDIKRDPEQIIGSLLDGVLGPASGAIEDIIGDDKEREAFWEGALNSAFGLVPLPGGKVAGLVIRKTVGRLIDETLTTDDGGRQQIGSARGEAIAATVAQLYADPRSRNAIVDQALDNWDITADDLRTQFSHEDDKRLVEDEIEKIRRALVASRRTGADPLDAETFVELPDVGSIVRELEKELAISPVEVLSG